MRVPISPLTEKHRVDIEKALAVLKDVQTQIHRAQAAGLPMDRHQRQHDQHKQILENFLTHYFPPRG